MKDMIVQLDDMGCGAACVAFVLNDSYEDTASKLGKVKAKTKGFKLKELTEFLINSGLEYKFGHINRYKKTGRYADGTIVFIRRSLRYPYGHYLVRCENLWGDPWVNMSKDNNILHARSGYRKRLPGKVQWVIAPV